MSDLERRAILGLAGVVGVAAMANMAKGGPLSPPAEPVSSTGRTTDEIYDKIPTGIDGKIAIPGSSTTVTITVPGSYILTGNITPAAGTGGIIVSADRVTLDLNGYSVAATGPTSTTGTGILLSAGFSRFTLRNGTISGFNVGVALAPTTTGGVIEDLLIKDSRTFGILASSNDVRSFRVRRCTVVDTGFTHTATGVVGLTLAAITLTGAGHVIEECVVSRIGFGGTGTTDLRGISLSSASVGNVVARCVVTSTAAVTGTGIIFFGTGVYRENTVVGYSTAYSGGTNGGGNV